MENKKLGFSLIGAGVGVLSVLVMTLFFGPNLWFLLGIPMWALAGFLLGLFIDRRAAGVEMEEKEEDPDPGRRVMKALHSARQSAQEATNLMIPLGLVAVALIAGLSIYFSLDAKSQVSDLCEKVTNKADSSYVADQISHLQQNDIAEKASREDLKSTNEAVGSLTTSVEDLNNRAIDAERVANGAYRAAVEAKKLAQTMADRLVQSNELAVKYNSSTSASIKELGRQVGDLMKSAAATDKKIDELATRQDSIEARLAWVELVKKALADDSPPQKKFR